jgi:NAD(P)H-hydrate epimerase
VLAPRLAGYAALLVGPGLSQEKETVAFVHRLLGITRAGQARSIGFQQRVASEAATGELDMPPLVLDADGLNALARVAEWWTHVPENTILTPHPGEMARLTEMDRSEINENRLHIAQEYAVKWRQIVVLKGAHTVVASPDGHATLIPFANPSLATAGTGDVLAGVIAGMLAQGLAPFDAALCGAYLHGLAGEVVAGDMGPAGALAGDLLPALPRAIAWLHRSR